MGLSSYATPSLLHIGVFWFNHFNCHSRCMRSPSYVFNVAASFPRALVHPEPPRSTMAPRSPSLISQSSTKSSITVRPLCTTQPSPTAPLRLPTPSRKSSDGTMVESAEPSNNSVCTNSTDTLHKIPSNRTSSCSHLSAFQVNPRHHIKLRNLFYISGDDGPYPKIRQPRQVSAT